MHERIVFESDFDLTEMENHNCSHDKTIEKFVPTEHMNNLIFDYLLSNGHTSIGNWLSIFCYGIQVVIEYRQPGKSGCITK